MLRCIEAQTKSLAATSVSIIITSFSYHPLQMWARIRIPASNGSRNITMRESIEFRYPGCDMLVFIRNSDIFDLCYIGNVTEIMFSLIMQLFVVINMNNAGTSY